jgi:hypothetical protein
LNAPSADEIRQQAVFDAARSFSEAAARIDDATAQLKTLADLHDGQIPADSPDLAKLKAQLEQTQEQYRAAEAALWKQLGVRAK